MPRIPDIGPSVGVRTDPSGPQNISFGADAFGGNTAQALTNLGNVGQNITLDLQRQRNSVEAQKAFLEASTELDQFLHNPEDGVYSKLGANAPGSFKNTADKIPEIASKYTAGLNDAQRKLFERAWGQTANNSLSGVLQHESNQLKAEKVSTAEALTALNINNMGMNYGNPKALADYARGIESSVDLAADVRGTPKVRRDLIKQEALTKGYARVFEQYYQNEDYEGAEKVLNDYSDKMQPGVVAKLRADVKVKQMDVKVQDNRDVLIAEFGTDYEGALAAATKRYKGREETAVINALKTHYADQERIQNKKDADAYYTGLNNIQEAKTRTQAMVIADRETDPQKRFQLRNAVDHKFPLPTQASLIANSKSQLKEKEADRIAQVKLDMQDLNNKDKAMQLANAEKDPEVKLALRSFVARTYPEVKVELTPQQKEQRETQKFVAERGLSREYKIELAQNQSLPRDEASIAAGLKKRGIYSLTAVKDVFNSANNDGPYKNITNKIVGRIRELGLAEKYQTTSGGRKGPVIPPQELVDFMARATANNGGELNTQQFNKVFQDALTGITVAKPGRFYGTNKVVEPWFKHSQTASQEGYDALRTMEPVDRNNMKALISWGLKREPKAGEVNDYAVSWLEGAYDMTERRDADKIKRFYDYGKSFVGRVMDYPTNNGGRVQRRITDSDLSRKEFWAAVFRTYPARTKR